jgi:phage terminase large subunit GpA-like protein
MLKNQKQKQAKPAPAKKRFRRADELIEAAFTRIKKRLPPKRKRIALPERKKALHAETALSSPLGLAEWIEANIVLPNTVAEPGPMTLWPWQYGIAEAFVDPEIERVTLQKGTRLGFTALCAAYLGYIVVVLKKTVLYVLPTENDARGFMVDDVEALFEATPVLQGQLMAPAIARHDRNTLLHRLFPGGSLKVVAGKSPRNFRRHTAENLIVDESDAIEVSGEGDPIGLA